MQKSTDREGDSEVEKRLGTVRVAYGRGKPGELSVVNTLEKTPYSSCKKTHTAAESQGLWMRDVRKQQRGL